MNPHILLVEDQDKLARLVKLELSDEGYVVSVTPNGKTGLTTAQESHPDLVILDWSLPDLSGLEICRRLRASGNQVPIIFVTARDEDRDRLAGLEAGANDYMVKPFNIEELLSKIKTHLRCEHPQRMNKISSPVT